MFSFESVQLRKTEKRKPTLTLICIFFKPDDDVPLQEQLWFHGTVDRKDIPNLLKNDGDYLVRESSTKPGQFVLSTRFEGVLKHFIIQYSDDVSTAFSCFGFHSLHR